MNLMMLLEMAHTGFGDRVAFVSGKDSLSYSELFAAAGAAAAEIKASGCARLAVLDESSLAIPIGLFASAWAGVPFVPLNYRLSDDELASLVTQIAPAYLVTSAERVDALAATPDLTVVSREGFLEKARGGTAPASEWNMDPEEIAILLFTSGTTGAPKAAILRHKHIVSYVLGSIEFGSADESAAALVCVPPYHIAGIAAIATSVYSTRRIAQLPNFDAKAWLDLARSERVTNAFLVPTMLSRLIEALEDSESADLPHLRALSYGGGKMPLPVIERAMDLFPDTDFTNAYGLTETSSTISLLTPDDHRGAAASNDPAVRRRLTSVGRVLPSLEVEIRDEDGNALGPDERGEIYVRGEQVSGEYLGRGSLLVEGGWFPTADGGSLDAEGYLFVSGRIDDVIVRGGENLSPGEIEDVLIAHHAVADVAVVGVPDERWGEAVKAIVVRKDGETVDAEALLAHCKGQLGGYKRPRSVDFIEALPRNPSGKVLKKDLREPYWVGHTRRVS